MGETHNNSKVGKPLLYFAQLNLLFVLVLTFLRKLFVLKIMFPTHMGNKQTIFFHNPRENSGKQRKSRFQPKM